jgi:hypothetical protein
MQLAGANCDVELAGTSAAYYLLHSPEGDRSRVRVSADAGSELQITLIRVPSKLPRLDLRCENGRLLLTIHDADIKLDRVAWERVPPETNRQEDTNFRDLDPPQLIIRAWFGNPQIKAGETRRAAAYDFPTVNSKQEKMIFKVSAMDEGGHRLGAYVNVPATR